MITTKYRIYPNKNQTEKLEFALDNCRQAYNIMLGELRDQAIIDRNMIQSILPDLKICEPRFGEVYSKTLQYECYKLFSNLSALSALKKQGRKVGQLKFKGKKFFDTITYNQSGFDLEHIFGKNGRLKLSKIGDVKLKLHRLQEVNNQRTDFLHKTSTNLIMQCKVIVVEDLNIKGMMEQRYFNAKNITDSSWN